MVRGDFPKKKKKKNYALGHSEQTAIDVMTACDRRVDSLPGNLRGLGFLLILCRSRKEQGLADFQICSISASPFHLTPLQGPLIFPLILYTVLFH